MEPEDIGGRKRRLEEVEAEGGDPEEESDSIEVVAEEYEKKIQKKIKEVELEFDIRVIEDIDFKAIRLFLGQYCNKMSFNSSEFVEIICSQSEVGSVIRPLDTIETLGFITLVNMHHHREKLCIKQIKKFVLSSVPKEEKQKWEQVLAGDSLGLLVTERLINVPHALAPQLHETTFQEAKAAAIEGLPFHFDMYLYITNYGHSDRFGADHSHKKKSKAECNYFKAEDEIYVQQATMSCKVPVNHSETRLLLVIPAVKIQKILNDIQLLVSEGYSW